MKYLVCFEFVLVVAICSAFGQSGTDRYSIQLKTGDLLFCGATVSPLSSAIDRVTRTEADTHFDHVGLVDVRYDSIYVIHSAPGKGVCKESLNQFYFNGGKKIVIFVYRLKPQWERWIGPAIRKSYTLLGKPYNSTYRLSDPGIYCSEFIYQVYEPGAIFRLTPMTFRDPETGKFIPEWINHYKKIGVTIPEGEPGCNPNGLAASRKLMSLGQLKRKR